MIFETGIFYGFLVQGDLHKAIEYIKQFPSEAARLARYGQLFESQQYINYPVHSELQNILLSYQKYYRDVFYLRETPEVSARTLQSRLNGLLCCQQPYSLDILEESVIPEIFQEHGLHFMGGKTEGFRGPYVWRSTEETTYQVGLPAGVQPYTVRLHRDFITKSWLDYISFGEISTGGWSNGDGAIDCIADCYDVTSEAFQVSFLKHEAQHTRDLSHYPQISQEDLEYRAKLVELIYSEERDLLADFYQQSADATAHARAAKRICNELAGIPDRKSFQAKAQELLRKSNDKLADCR